MTTVTHFLEHDSYRLAYEYIAGTTPGALFCGGFMSDMIRGILGGKRVVLVDDSIIRGTTTNKIATMLRNAGAREVHVRISAPPTVGPCHYGIDMPTRAELIAHRMSVAEIRESLGVESLGYLSLEGLRAAARDLKHGTCDACFSDEYPVPIESDEATPQLSLFRPVAEDDDDPEPDVNRFER